MITIEGTATEDAAPTAPATEDAAPMPPTEMRHAIGLIAARPLDLLDPEDPWPGTTVQLILPDVDPGWGTRGPELSEDLLDLCQVVADALRAEDRPRPVVLGILQ